MKHRKNAYRILLLLAVLTGAALLTMRPERDAPEGGIVVAGGNTTERQILAERQAAQISLRAEVGLLASELAERIIGEQLRDTALTSRVVDRFLDELEEDTNAARDGAR